MLPTTAPAHVALDDAQLRQRFAADGLLVRDGRWAAGHLAVVAGAYAVTAVAAVALGSTVGWLVAWAVLSFLLLGAAAAVHEAVHGNLADAKATNRVAGVVAGLTLLLPWSTYRWFHHEHHLTTATRRDPEGDLTIRSRAMYLLIPLGGLLFVAKVWGWSLATLVGRPPRWVRSTEARRGVATDGVVALVVVGAAVAACVAGGPVASLLLRLWIVPGLITMAWWVSFVTLPEHHGTWDLDLPKVDQLATTMTTRSNAVLRFVFLETNHHAAHHLAPRVPGKHLAAADALVTPRQSDRWRSTGYTAWHLALLRDLPWWGFTAPKLAAEPAPVATPRDEALVQLT